MIRGFLNWAKQMCVSLCVCVCVWTFSCTNRTHTRTHTHSTCAQRLHAFYISALILILRSRNSSNKILWTLLHDHVHCNCYFDCARFIIIIRFFYKFNRKIKQIIHLLSLFKVKARSTEHSLAGEEYFRLKASCKTVVQTFYGVWVLPS